MSVDVRSRKEIARNTFQHGVISKAAGLPRIKVLPSPELKHGLN